MKILRCKYFFNWLVLLVLIFTNTDATANEEGESEDSYNHNIESNDNTQSELSEPDKYLTKKNNKKQQNENTNQINEENIVNNDNKITEQNKDKRYDPDLISDKKESEVDLDTVMVTGKTEGELLKESGYPVSIIDPSELGGRTITVSDILNRVSGVKVRKSGGIGSAQKISIRGLEGNRVKIYIDGSPLNAPDGSFGIDDLPIQVIDRIEVYKGVVPAKFGGDGLGGAINIVTIDIPEEKYIDALYSIQSYNSHRLMLLGKYTFEDPGIEVGAFFSGIYADNNYRADLPQGGTYTRDHDNYKQAMAAFVLSFKKFYFDVFDNEFVYIGNKKEIQGAPGFTGSDDTAIGNVKHARTYSNMGVYALHLEKIDFLTKDLDLIYGATVPFMFSSLIDTSDKTYDFEGNSYPSTYGSGELGTGPNKSNDFRIEFRQRLNLNYQIVKPFSLNLNNQIQYVYNSPEDKLADEAAGQRVTAQQGTMFTSVTGLSGELDLFENKWVSVFGVKHYGFTSSNTRTSLYLGTNGEEADKVTQNSNAVGANFATRYKIAEPFLLKFSYEWGQRLPTDEEIFGDGFSIAGSVDLKPEKSHNLTAGFYLDMDFGKGVWKDSSIKLEGNAFLMFIDNMIRLGGQLEKTYANVDEARIWGVDAEIKMELTKYFYWYFNFTYQDVRNTADTIAGTNQPNYLKDMQIPNIPGFYFNYGAEVTIHDVFGKWSKPSEWSLFYDAGYMDEFFFEYKVSNNQTMKVQSRLLHNIGTQVSWQNNRYTFSVECQNLGNVKNFDEYNMPLPGRIFLGTLRFTYM